MKIKALWIWKVYFLIYFLIVTVDIGTFFSPESPKNIYYQVLIAFDSLFIVPFLLNALAVILDVLSLVPFYGFIEGIAFLSKKFWRLVFMTRLVLALWGHSYDFQLIRSLSHENINNALAFVAVAILLNIPSYAAMFLYAFQKDEKTEITR